ncbi:MAG TPA: alpha,alpha-trehalase TreF [Candidatus Saccharimonadales bacterium]
MLRKKVKAGFTNLAGIMPARKGPDELLGQLFQDVQLRRIHPDGKTFVDLVSKKDLRQIAKAYEKARQAPNFDLEAFLKANFQDYVTDETYTASDRRSATDHIEALWQVLTRQTYLNKGSIVALPYPYIVPGGRFAEQFYWDTYFIMLGLATSGHIDEIEDMMKNYAYMIRKLGFIPTANRTYFLSRSHPPFFAKMVQLLAEQKGKRMYVQYLPYLLAEYAFWMKGSRYVNEDRVAWRRVVRMPNGVLLNRYYDAKMTPRPESYREDIETAAKAPERIASQVYLDLRAGAESGWDYSSRWFKDANRIETIHTTDIVPVDLNCLLYELEQTISHTYRILKQGLLAKRFEAKAAARAEAIRTYCWSDEKNFFVDYDFIAGAQKGNLTLAGMFPLYARVATPEQATAASNVLQKRFLKPLGLTTTLVDSGQQWDAPNGWAPLQWVSVQGLRNYGLHYLADEVMQRWLNGNLATYNKSYKFVEKYNVYDGASASGGEYELQDGFGWTNGVFLALNDKRGRDS